MEKDSPLSSFSEMIEYTARSGTEYLEEVEDDKNKTTTLNLERESGGENIGIDYFEMARKGANKSEKKVVLLNTTEET